MKRQAIKLTLIFSALFAAVLLLTACSGGKSSSPKQTTITVGLDGSTQPFEYTKNGALTGYDVEVANAVFAKLPQYKLDFQIMDFASIATSLDNGRIQLGANDFGWNAARAEKYYFTAPISKSNNAVAVRKDAPSYTDLKSLAGLKTEGNAASNYVTAMQAFNAQSNNPIQISYTSGQTPFSNRLTDIVNGKIDFILYDKISLKSTINQLGFDSKLKIEDIEMGTNDPAHDGFEYFLLAKNAQGKTLQTAINKVLSQLQADGTLKKLSQKYLSGDFVPDASEFKL
jgi:polar amino acid transport system substrate-binding protein